MKWVMSSTLTQNPWTLTFYIGGAKIAEISFLKRGIVCLDMWRREMELFDEPKGVSRAMQRMHQILETPPTELTQ